MLIFTVIELELLKFHEVYSTKLFLYDIFLKNKYFNF